MKLSIGILKVQNTHYRKPHVILGIPQCFLVLILELYLSFISQDDYRQSGGLEL